MATSSIGFDIFARDRASATLDRVGQSAEKTGGSFDKMKGFAVAAGALAGAAIVTFGQQAIGKASDLNETISKSNIIFGKNAGQIEAWATGAAKSLGLSKAAALNTAAGFGDMFLQLGISGDAATKMSTQVVQMVADLSSFNNLPTADVADMMAGAFRGEYDSLQKLIPNISDARVKQEALAATHKKTAAELTNAEKAAAVFKIVTADASRATGDFARTSDGLANSQKIAAAEMDNASASLGAKLLPAQIAVTQAGIKLMDFGTAHTGVLKGIAAAVGVLALGWGIATAATAAHTIAAGLSTAGTIAQTVATNAAAVASNVWAAGQWLLNAALSANPIGLVVIAIGALVAGLVLAYQNSETFRTIVHAAITAVSKAGRAMWDDYIKPAFTGIGTAFGAIGDAAGSLWTAVQDAFGSIVAKFISMAGTIIDGAAAIFGWVPGVGPKLVAAAAKFDTFRDNVNAALGGTNDSKTIAVRTAGAQAAIDALGRLRWAQDQISPTVTQRVVTIATRAGMNAAGTNSWRGGPTWVGERGPELIDLPFGTAIHSNGESMAMVGAAVGAGAGAGTTNVTINVNGAVGSPDDIARALTPAIRNELAGMVRNGARLGF